MKTTLLIMAAGIGSRFGTGIKQLEPVDDAGHIIMDYSIHDAIEAGFNHVVFIIRKVIEKEFKEVIGDRIAFICSSHNVTVDYAFQDINDIPGTLPEGRTKPYISETSSDFSRRVRDITDTELYGEFENHFNRQIKNRSGRTYRSLQFRDVLAVISSNNIQYIMTKGIMNKYLKAIHDKIVIGFPQTASMTPLDIDPFLLSTTHI